MGNAIRKGRENHPISIKFHRNYAQTYAGDGGKPKDNGEKSPYDDDTNFDDTNFDDADMDGGDSGDDIIDGGDGDEENHDRADIIDGDDEHHDETDGGDKDGDDNEERADIIDGDDGEEEHHDNTDGHSDDEGDDEVDPYNGQGDPAIIAANLVEQFDQDGNGFLHKKEIMQGIKSLLPGKENKKERK